VNPYARPPACSTCNDVRRITLHVRAHEGDLSPCPHCGLLNDEEYERFRHDSWVKAQKPPEICELDLDEKEFAVYTRLRSEHPKTSKTTVLSWMEGQRYTKDVIAKDETFLVEARQKFREWKARVNP